MSHQISKIEDFRWRCSSNILVWSCIEILGFTRTL